MSRFNALREGTAKPEFAKHPALAALRSSLEKIIGGSESLSTKRAELAKDQNLSELGRGAQLRDVAALHAAPIAKAERMLAKARAANRQKRDELAPTAKNPGDVAEAILKMEIRGVMRTLPPAQAMATASAENASRLVVEAVMEAPQLLHGIPQQQIDQLRNVLIERTGGAKLQELHDEAEALDFAGAVIADCKATLSDSAGFQRTQHGAALSPGFASWFARAAGPSDEPSERTEFARAVADATLANAKALVGTDFDALRTLNSAVSAGITALQLAGLKA